MKIMISFLSLIVVALGVFPFIPNLPLPNSGTGYAVILASAGVTLIVAAIFNNLLIGLEKFFLGVEGAVIVIIASLPWLPGFLTFLPREGPFYAVMIIIAGAMGLFYGLLGMG